MNTEQKEQIERIVRNNTENIFADLVDKFALPTGDVDPLQDMGYEIDVESLIKLAIDFVKQNEETEEE